MLPESQIIETYKTLDSQLDEQAKAQAKKDNIKYIVYAGATLILFAIVMFSIKKLKK